MKFLENIPSIKIECVDAMKRITKSKKYSLTHCLSLLCSTRQPGKGRKLRKDHIPICIVLMYQYRFVKIKRTACKSFLPSLSLVVMLAAVAEHWCGGHGRKT